MDENTITVTQSPSPSNGNTYHVRVNGVLAGSIWKDRRNFWHTQLRQTPFRDRDTVVEIVANAKLTSMRREWDLVEDASGQPYHLHILCKAITLTGICPKCGGVRPFGE